MIQVLGVCYLAIVAACFGVMFVVFGLEVRDIWWRRRGHRTKRVG